MNTDSVTKGVIAENFSGIGTVSLEMVEKRAEELALINGRPGSEITESDLDQAQRELTGRSDIDPKDAFLETVPESERADSEPASSGFQIPKTIEDDEDEEGRSIGEQLVSEGVNEAEHDQMLQAARLGKKLSENG